ncbi:hypothetical protein BR93DRAFT_397809 [Coniochaeta sp. PMI_546]|nr:hypothetical protein BR93DRAFT_397809 [Coniochaeta sp. PMI_546]
METATLQSPKTGKSRFSKALPAPPSFLKSLKGLPSSPQPSKSHLPPARKPLPTVSAVPPSLPPKENLPSPVSPSNTMAKPLGSPLPPVPLNSTKPSAPLPTISRRPVAAGSPGLPSPDDSPLSSLLSAYTDSNRSSDSTHISSNDGVTPASSAQESYQTSPKHDSSPFAAAASSPKLDELFFTPLSIQSGGNNETRNPERSGRMQQTVEGGAKQLPLPPFKDFDVGTQRQPAKEHTPSYGDSPSTDFTLGAPQASPEAPIPQSPQSQPQIWRRRSVKAEKTLAVPELKLVSSNGSTTSTSTLPAPQPPPKKSSPILLQPQASTSASGPAALSRSPLPLTPNAAFPGRNIRPVASRQQLVEDGPDSMGQEVSRVKKTLKGADSGDISGVTRQPSPPSPPRRTSPSSATAHSKNASISSPLRLPTPEYDTDDFKGPIVETIVSPVSPASSPELLSEPRQRQQRPVQETRDTRPVKSSSSVSPSQNEGGQESSNSLAPKLPLQGLGVRSPAGLPSSPAASRTGVPQLSSQFPARTTSKAPATSPAASDLKTDNVKAATVSAPLQKARTVSEVGSIETIKAARQEQYLPAPDTQLVKEVAREEDTTSNPGAALFPRGWEREMPKDTVYQPVPVSERHHRCMSRHQVMHQVRNTYYPLACQACSLKDISWRYVCGSCNLRICKSCRMSLRKFNGDLHALMKHNDSVIVEQSTELEFDHEEAAIQSGKASTAQQKTSSQTGLAGQP